MLIQLTIESEGQLDTLLSEPTPPVIETMRQLDGDIVILGDSTATPTLAELRSKALIRI